MDRALYQACDEIDYDSFGEDDVIRLVRRELAYFPESCLSKLIMEWYNATYVALGEPITVGCVEEPVEITEQYLKEELVKIIEPLEKNKRVSALNNFVKDVRGILEDL